MAPVRSRFTSLKGFLPASHFDNLIGTVVEEKVEPRSSYRPARDSEDARTLLRSVYTKDNSVSIVDLTLQSNDQKGNASKLRLDKIFRAKLASNQVHVREIKAAEGHRYFFDNYGVDFEKKLWSNPQYREELMRLVNYIWIKDKKRLKYQSGTQHRGPVIKLPLLTQFLTCTKLRVVLDDGTETYIGVEGAVPVGEIVQAAAGVPPLIPIGDVGAGHERQAVHAEHASAQASQEVAIAAAYDWVTIPLCDDTVRGGIIPEQQWFYQKLINSMLGNACPICQPDKEYHERVHIPWYPKAGVQCAIEIEGPNAVPVFFGEDETDSDDEYSSGGSFEIHHEQLEHADVVREEDEDADAFQASEFQNGHAV